MNLKKIFLATIVSIFCSPTILYAGFIQKSASFLVGAAFAPYINCTLFAQNPNFNLHSINSEASQEVANNLSYGWKNSKEWFSIARKKLEKLEKNHK